MEKENIKKEAIKIFDSKVFIHIMIGLGAFIVALFIFAAGVSVGSHKAEYVSRIGENYNKIFGADHDVNMQIPHGTIGKIIKIDASSIVVLGKDNVEKIILTDDDTMIKHFHDDIKFSDISIGDSVVVIGSPDDQGQIVAKLIRVVTPSVQITPSIQN